MTKERHPIEVLIAELNGSCKGAVIAGINGNLPSGWTAGGLRAMATFRSPAIAVICDASPGTWSLPIGAKLEIDAPYDHLKLADELARQLCEKIRKLPRSGVRIALDPGAIMPTRGSEGASGYDLYAPTDVLIRRGQVVIVHSGVHIDLPDATWEIQTRPRSSMNLRGLWANIGTIDSDYRGVVGATIINLSQEDQTIKRGERFAQMVFARVDHPEIEQVEVAELTPTARGEGAFGSTGR